MFRRALHGLVAACLAVTTLMVAGQTLVGLDDCYSRLEVDAHIPDCCHAPDVDTVEGVKHSCCLEPFVADLSESSTTASTPDVPRAASSAAPLPPRTLLTSLSPGARGFHPIVERPPDRAPQTSTTVLVV